MTTTKRPTMREVNEKKAALQRVEMQDAIDEGRLTVRQMTPSEHAEADAHRAAGDEQRAMHAARKVRRRETGGRTRGGPTLRF